MGKDYDEYEDDMIETSSDYTEKENKKPHNSHKTKKTAKRKNIPDHKKKDYAKNNAKSGKGKKKRKRSFKAKFFMFLTVLLTICCVAVTAFIVCFYLGVFDQKEIKEKEKKEDNPVSTFTNIIKPSLPERTTFLLAGTDEDKTRTDTIMVGCYNSELKELTLVSIPRDTIVYVDDQTYELMNEHYPEPGQQGMKVNALHHYGTGSDEDDDDREIGLAILQKWVEDQIGTDIDYTVRIDFEAFNYLIDSIGGIDYDVPIRMYYQDPGQDLYIDLQPGPQHLNGKQAEGLVRFRHDYINGDIGRVEQQQAFMKELIKQLADKDTIFSNVSAYVTTFFKYVDTNISIADAVKFAAVFEDFDKDNVVTYTLPGDGGSLYDISGGWIMDENEAHALFNEIFVKPSSEIKKEREAAAAADKETTTNSQFNDKELEIQVLNGSYTDGLATKVLTDLASLGYNTMSTGTYVGDKTVNTRIYVKEDGMAQSLVDNFKDCEIIVDHNVDFTEKYDIVIVLGTGEE